MSLFLNSQVSSKECVHTMLNVFCKQKSGLNVCHINAQSLCKKIDEFRHIFEDSGVDVVCVSETWFHSTLLNSFVDLCNYNLLRSDRVRTEQLQHGGGVALYIKSNLKYKIVLKSTEYDLMEYIFVEILANEHKTLVGVVYRRRYNIDMQALFDVLGEISFRYSKVIVTGDLNSDLLKESLISQKFADMGLFPVNFTRPTHFTSTASTLLDVFFVNDKNLVQFYDQLSVPQFSRHDLIFIIFDHPTLKADKKISYFDFNNIDFPHLDADFHAISWRTIYSMPTVDEQVEFLTKNILDLFNKHVPVRSKILKKSSQPWFNHDISSLIHRRNVAYHKWKRYKTSSMYEEFRNLRKQVNSTIKMAKTQYFLDKFSNAADSKSKWRTIKEIGLGKTCSQEINVDLDELNQKFVGIDPSAEQIHTFSICDQNTCDTLLTNLNLNCDNPSNSAIFTNSRFSFVCVNECDVLSCLLSVKSNSIGLDGIHPKFIKLLITRLLTIITYIFNNIITKSLFPKAWKNAKIIPVPKSASEYRPIAILPYFSKAFEVLLYKQMYGFFNSNSLLTSRQSGFRPKRSCTTAILDVSEDIRQNLDAGKPSFLVLLDCTKAFDSLDHAIFCYKLKNLYGFSSQAVKLISSYLSERFQCVYSGASSSGFLHVSKGVPQGSVLGPFLFVVYVNDFPLTLKESSCHMYADDLQIYLSCNKTNIQGGADILNHELRRVSSWASANKLKINPSKSKCIFIFKKSIDHSSLPPIKINNDVIEYVDKAKNLGFIFNNTLTWNDHINNAVGRVCGMLRCLWVSQCYTPLKARHLIAQTYLIPVLLYGCEAFANADSIHFQKLKVCYNNIARYIYNLKIYDHVSDYAYRINNMSFENLLKTRVLLLMHKIIFSQEPIYLFEKIRFTRSQRNNNMVPIKHAFSLSERHFFLYGARLWNSLNNRIQQNRSAIKFKQEISSYLRT